MEGFKLLYWHWIILGMVLILLELAITSFTIFWFGLGALAVAVLLLVVPELSLAWQIFTWILASIGFTVAWFKYFKPLMTDKTTAGIAREAIIGESGQVIKAPGDESRGTMQFAIPILGSDTWQFICEQDVSVGDRVFVKEISGNTMIVEKRN